MAENSSVRVADCRKSFKDVAAVADLSLHVRRGEFFALLGPSGSGKTTTLRMVGGFERPDAGRVFIGAHDITDEPPHRRPVNTVFQTYALFPHLSVFDNVAFGLRRSRTARAEMRRRVGEALELVALGSVGGRRPSQLSGGQQQRVALARALVNRPDVLLLDEPLGALDLRLRRQMQLELKRIQSEVGITFIHVTHDQEEAMTMADTVAVMNEGRLHQAGAPEALYERPATAFVAGFLGTSNLLTGTVVGPTAIELDERTQVTVPAERLGGRSGRIAVGIRPERIRMGGDGENVVPGRVRVASFTGATTQYVLDTPVGEIVAVTANRGTEFEAPAPGASIPLAWDARDTFVVEAP